MKVETGGDDRTTRVRAFLIADVRGYTAFTRERGDAEAARLAKRFADLAREAVEARRGHVIELRGDEALAVFDSTAQAVRAALEFQMTCAEETAEQPDLPLTVGIGIDVGEAIPVEDGFRGVALNTAARLCSKALAGQVLVTRDVAEGAGSVTEARFLDRGAVELKGFEEPVPIVEAILTEPAAPTSGAGSATPEAPPLELDTFTPLVDREREMQWLRGTWRQARRGSDRVLFVSGPSQIGKTRLAAEIAAEVAPAGARIVYAGLGGAAAAQAIAAVRKAASATDPTLVVLDDLDVAGEDAASLLGESLEGIASRPVLVLALVKNPDANPALAGVVERADRLGDGVLALPPLAMEGVEGIAKLYVGEEVEHVPLESMARASAGVPGRVHEVVSDWARDEAGRRLSAAAEWLSEGRGRRSADLEFANNVIGLKLGTLYSAEAQIAHDDGCPYKGLAAFDETDAAYFFGREQLVGELAARTVGVGLLGVVGASGSGKSSAVAAGLLPSLRAGLLPGSERWRQVVFRPGEHPIAELERALGGSTLADAIESTSAEERLVVAIDQFEEIYTLCTDEGEREEFCAAIARAADTSPERVVFVLTIRDDFYGRCAPYRELSDLLTANHVLVPPMTAEELRRAIDLPARRAGLRVDGALADALVEEVAEEPGGLPLLSAALVELWQNREDGWLRMKSYERTGGVRGAVARLAEATFLELEQREREVARRILLRLAGVGEGELVTRRRVQLSELDVEKDRATAHVLARMTRDRLLTMSDSTVEVAHEALLREWPRLRAWLEEDLQGQKLWQHLTQAAKQWESSGRDTSELYRGARLSAAIDWSAAHGRDLNELESEFLAESRQASEHEAERQRKTNRRLRGLLVGTGVFLAVALVAGALALVQRGRARDETVRAEREARLAAARELASAAVANLEVDPERSILLALEGVNATWEVDRSVVPEAEEALHRALRSSRTLLTVPEGGGLAVSPDGSTFATTGEGTASVWRTATGERLLTLEGHTGPVNDVAFSPDGSLLATAGDDATARIWDAESGEPIHVLRGHEGRVFGATFSPDGRLLASIGDDSDAAIRLWNVDPGTEARVLRGPVQAPFFVLGVALEPAFSPDGSRIASGGWGKTATVWDVATGDIAMTLPAHTWEVTGVEFSPDGSQLATAAVEGTARTWDAKTGRRLTTFTGHTGDLLDLDYSADGKLITTAGSDAIATVWDAATGENLVTLAGHPAAVRLAEFTPEGDRLVTAGADGTTRVWDLGITGERDWLTVPGPALRMGGVAFSPDAKTFAVPKQLAGVTIHDVDTGEEVMSLTGSEATITNVVFSPDGERLAGVTSSGATRGPQNWIIPVWDVGTGELAVSLKGHEEEVPELAFSPDGRKIVTTGYDGTMRLWDGATGEELKQTEVEDAAFALGFTPDGRHLVAAPGYGGGVEVRDAETLQLRYTLRGHEDYVQRLSFAPDGRVVTSSGDGTARVWDLDRRRQIAVMRGHTGAALGVAFSPDGERVATTSDDGTAKIWDARTGREILTLYGHDRVVNSVAYSSDGRFLATVSGDGTVAVHLLSIEELRKTARARVTRELTDLECRQYLHMRRCASRG